MKSFSMKIRKDSIWNSSLELDWFANVWHINNFPSKQRFNLRHDSAFLKKKKKKIQESIYPDVAMSFTEV